MATAASEEEQGKGVEIVPADPDPRQQQEVEGRDVMAHPYYGEQNSASEEVSAAEIMELLSKVQALHVTISQLLGSAGPHHVVTNGDDVGRCYMLFVETELRFIAAFLTALKFNPQLFAPDTSRWVNYCFGVVKRIVRTINPGATCRSRLLRRAARCFFPRRKWYPDRDIQKLYYEISLQTYTSFMHVLTSSDTGLTPQLAEIGALPLVGMDGPAKKLLRWLTPMGEMDKGVRVISIVGHVGVGKTTLALELQNRLIRHEASSGDYNFDCIVMAQASPGTDGNILLLQDILSQVSKSALSSDPSQANTLEVLRHLVLECLRDKRYLVIIDNIWEAWDWRKIKGAFPNNNFHSRILVTTRSKSTAWACCHGSYDGLVHEIKPLSKMDSERLLLEKAFGSVDVCLPNDIKLHCDEILRRCDGIPLFIIGMADWLKEHRLQQREDDDEEHQRFPISFDQQVPLPPEWLEQALYSASDEFHNYDGFRLLLLYLSMFPYGYKFEKDRLILKWIHEGLIPGGNVYLEFPAEGHTAMLDAETIFFGLLDRNVITCVAPNCKHKHDHKHDEAEDSQWQVNHFIQQFLASKCAAMDFIFTTTTLNLLAESAAATTECGNQTSSRMPRRLALHHADPLLPSLLETMDLSQTHSLSVSGTVNDRIILLHRFVNLVVLDLEGWENLQDENLVQVCKSNMFLTYLSIRNTRVSKLPHEVKELQNLRTLDVSYTQISELPLELFKLTCLFHLDLRGTRISQLPKQIVDPWRLQFLRVGDEGIINHNVLHFDMLMTLATVDLTQHPASFISAFGSLNRSRVLAVTWSSHHSIDRECCNVLLSSIGYLKYELKSLTIHCGLGCSMEFLGSLEEFGVPRWLEKFKVTAGRFSSVPPWIHRLEHLAFMQITVCNKQTTTDDLQILGSLPKLQCLILGLDFIPGQPIVIGNEGFHELQRFSVDCPMPWLAFSTGTMPKLTYLQLKFSSTPASEICVPSGISNLRRLTEVSLCYNVHYINSPSVKMTVEAVTQQVAEHRNPIDLFINGFELDDVQEVDDEVTEIKTGTSSRTNAGAEDDGQAVVEEATAAIQCEITEEDS